VPTRESLARWGMGRTTPMSEKKFLHNMKQNVCSIGALTYTVCGKKVSPKVVCHFLSNHLEFLSEILHVYYLLYAHKNAKRHLIAFNYCKVTEFCV